MKAVINIKVDAQTKKQAQKIAEQLGLSLSSVLNGYLQQFITERQITFSAPLKMSAKLEKILEPIEEDIKAGRNMVGPFKTAAEMLESLKN